MKRKDNLDLSTKKRHKKHKKHKRKKDDDQDAIDSEIDVDFIDDEDLIDDKELDDIDISVNISAADKLKSNGVDEDSSLSPQKLGIGQKSKKRQKGGGKDSGTSSEEERWLDAIQSGKLEEVDDELKKIKDPKLMTARQRAMYERGNDKETIHSAEILMSLPSGYKEKIMTAEAIQKAALKSQKRKQLADEKREKDKKKTMDRLLKKQDSKVKSIKKGVPTKNQDPMIIYINTQSSKTVTFPPNFEIPFAKSNKLSLQIIEEQTLEKKPVMCAIAHCNNIKRYNCSKTNTPLCSFKCYKQNFENIKQIIC